MKNLFYTLMAAVVIVAAGCPRLDSIESLNSLPRMVFNGEENAVAVIDSIKISLKNSQGFYDIEIKLFDENNNLFSLKYQQVTGGGILYQNGNPVEGSNINFEQDLVINLSYDAVSTGLHTLVFNLKDVFEEIAVATLELEAFDNLLPVAVFSINRPATQNDPREYIVDASGSFDRDQKYGGGITGYEYTFLGKTILVEDSSIPVVFPAADNYDISVRVRDNDSRFSEMVTITMKIE